MAKRITDIVWKETSGVDHPANLVEGWLVMKSKDINVDEIKSFIDEFEKVEKAHQNAADLAAALSAYLEGDVPSKVADAIKVVIDYLKELATEEYGYYGYGYAYPEMKAKKDDEGYPKPKLKSIISALKSLVGMAEQEVDIEFAKSVWDEKYREPLFNILEDSEVTVEQKLFAVEKTLERFKEELLKEETDNE